jgi:hypothetical protein
MQPLAADQIKPLPVGFTIKTSARELEPCNAPFFEVLAYKHNNNKSYTVLYRSPVATTTVSGKDVTWPSFRIPLSWTEGLDAPLKIRCFNLKQDGHQELIGTAIASLREFTFGEYQLALINKKKAKR